LPFGGSRDRASRDLYGLFPGIGVLSGSAQAPLAFHAASVFRFRNILLPGIVISLFFSISGVIRSARTEKCVETIREIGRIVRRVFHSSIFAVLIP